jgi:hypothetical protein
VLRQLFLALPFQIFFAQANSGTIGSSKTTEIYTHVAANTFKAIKNPLD